MCLLIPWIYIHHEVPRVGYSLLGASGCFVDASASVSGSACLSQCAPVPLMHDPIALCPTRIEFLPFVLSRWTDTADAVSQHPKLEVGMCSSILGFLGRYGAPGSRDCAFSLLPGQSLVCK